MHAGMSSLAVFLLWITLGCVSGGNTTDCTPSGQKVITCEATENTCNREISRGEHTLSAVKIVQADMYSYTTEGQKLVNITVAWEPTSPIELNFTEGYFLEFFYSTLNSDYYDPPVKFCIYLRVQSLYPHISTQDSEITFSYTVTRKDEGFEQSDLQVEIRTAPYPLYEPEQYVSMAIKQRTTASPHTQQQYTTTEVSPNSIEVSTKGDNPEKVSTRPIQGEPDLFPLWWVVLLGVVFVMALIVTTIVLVWRCRNRNSQTQTTLNTRPKICICYTPATDMYKQLYEILSSVIENYLYCDVISYTGSGDSSVLLKANIVIVVSCNELHDAYLTFNSSLRDRIGSIPSHLIPAKKLLEKALQSRSNLRLVVVTFSTLKNGWLFDVPQQKEIFKLPEELQSMFFGLNLTLPNDRLLERWSNFQTSELKTELDATTQKITLNNTSTDAGNMNADDCITVDTAYFNGTHLKNCSNPQYGVSPAAVDLLYPNDESRLSSYPNSASRALYGPNTYDQIGSLVASENDLSTNLSIERQISDAPLLEGVVTKM